MSLKVKGNNIGLKYLTRDEMNEIAKLTEQIGDRWMNFKHFVT